MDSPGSFHVFWAGLQALLTPALILSAISLGMAGLAVCRRRFALDHAISTVVLILVYSAALARRGPSTLDDVTRWIVVVAGLILLDAGRRRVHSVHPNVLVWSILLGALAVLLRTNIYGPVLGVLEGPWQSAASFADLWLYHLGSGAGLGVVYVLGILFGRRLPEEIPPWMGLVTAVGVILVVGLGQLDELQRALLLRWPPVTWG